MSYTSDIGIDPAKAFKDFLDCFSDHMLLNDLGPSLTCTECEVLAALLVANGESKAAQALRKGHCIEDDEGDLPAHLELKAKLEKEKETE